MFYRKAFRHLSFVLYLRSAIGWQGQQPISNCRRLLLLAIDIRQPELNGIGYVIVSLAAEFAAFENHTSARPSGVIVA